MNRGTGPHRTRNRVLQYVQVATPNRSTFWGGAPQFGQFSATGPVWPAGTMGPWIGGGGGIRYDMAPREVAKTIMMTTKTMKRQIGAKKKTGNADALAPSPLYMTPTKPATKRTAMTTATMRAGDCQARGRGGGP